MISSVDALLEKRFVQVPGYTPMALLYQGTKTLVYRAWEIASQRPVVIKYLNQDYPSFGELVQFRNQYTITKNLSIPGIVKPLGLEPCGHSYALIMEDVGGVSLDYYAQQQTFDIAESLAIAIQLADILHDLQQHRVIHKDIKPANILIQPNTNQVKLIDFSIASLLPKENQPIQSPNRLEGTLAYLAPEQTGRMNRGIDYRTDFYSLGITLYHLLSGQLPFVSNDPIEVIYGHIAQVPLPVQDINPKIPAMVSALVAKLMAKNSEDRYQSALGLKHDLEHCLCQWKKQGEIAEFSLGQRDLSDRFTIPEKLYGREPEVQLLLETFERVAQGTSELILVAGGSGIGKTSVVNEIYKPIVRQRGYFIKGKFDQLNRNIPLSAFIQAFRDLVGQLLSESDIELQTWKNTILDALGNNAQVIIDLVPELETLVGPQPSAPALSGTAAQNRFNLLCQKFIAVFTIPSHPLVIFIDDLQWADSASLNLIQVLMAEAQTGHLLLLGAYRDNEVFSAHPLMLTVEEFKKTDIPINTITLQPLSVIHLQHLVADTLHAHHSFVQPLTQLVMQKTQGNPFFATQLLKALHQNQLITFDIASNQWQYTMSQVQDTDLANDIVALMVAKVQKLPEKTQAVLRLAACIGTQFDLETLAIISEQSITGVATALWPALQDGFVLPINQVYKVFQNTDFQQSSHFVNPRYHVLHDQVQQAAYSLITNQQKSLTHWRIGRLLLQRWAEQSDDKLFDLVNQLNLGKSVITQSAEKKQLAQLNLQAGRKAKLSTAYQAAQTYFETGIALLTTAAWETDYDLMYELYYHGSETAYLSSQFDQAEKLYAVALKQAKTALEKATIYRIQMTQYQFQGRNAEAIAIQCKSTQLLGYSIPTKPSQIQSSLDAEIAVVTQFLEQNTIASILELPEMTDANTQEILRILQILFYAAWLDGQPTLALLALAKMTTLSLQYGNSEMSPFGYVGYGIVANAILKDATQAHQFGSTAVQLCEQFDNADVSGMTNFLFAADVHSWKRPLREADTYYENAYKYSMDAGNWLTVSFTMMLSGSDRLTFGKNLDDLYAIVQSHAAFLQRIKSLENLDALTVGVLQPIRQLLGLTYSSTSFDDDQFSEAAYLEKYKDTPYHLAWYYSVKIRHAYLFDQVDAYPTLIPNVAIIERTIPTHAKLPSTVFYSLLMHLALIETAENTEQHWQAIQTLENKLEQWQHDCPGNIHHKYLLIQAEKARLQGQMAVAIDFYDQSIAQAKHHGYGYEAALANELAAKCCLAWGKEKFASPYMQEAYYGYSRWGAKAKVMKLETNYPQLLHPILNQTEASIGTLNMLMNVDSSKVSVQFGSAKSSRTTMNDSLDLATILKASQMLSSSIQLDELLHQLTQIILQNSGGDRCALMLPTVENEWQVRAIAQRSNRESTQRSHRESATPDEVQLCNDPLIDNPNVPVKLIQYVKNTQEVVVIDDIETDLPIMDDYLRQRKPKSVLCLPILHQGHCISVLYLKNSQTRGVFTDERILILNFLCTQAAISLENARLYQQEQERTQKIAQKETEYRSIFESVNDGLALMDLATGQTVAVNPRMCKMYGYSQDEWLTLEPSDFIHPSYIHEFTNFMDVLNRGEEFGTQAVALRKDGRSFDIEVKSVPFIYQGKPHGLSVVRDISERQKSENALRASEVKFRALLSNLDGVVYRCQNDADWTMEFMSDAITMLSGYPESDFINNQKRTYASIIYPDDVALVSGTVAQSLELRQSFAMEYRIIHQDGSVRWVTEKGKGIFDATGELQYLDGVIFDISDRKQAEANSRLLASVVESSDDAIITKRLEDGIITSWNQAAVDLFGYSATEAIGQSIAILFPADRLQEEAQIIARLRNKERIEHFETVRLHKDSSPIDISLTLSPLVDSQGHVVGASKIVRDIRARKQAEAQINKKSQELEIALTQLQHSQLQLVQNEKMSALGGLVAGVAHEINNPVGCIVGNVDVTQEYISDLLGLLDRYAKQFPDPGSDIEDELEMVDLEYVREDLPKLMRSMKDSGDRIKSISKSLRTFSRSDTETKQPFDLREGIESTVLILRHRLKANEHRPDIEVETDYGDMPTIDCFAGQLNQVFMNILANAIDALDEASYNRSFDDMLETPHRIKICTSTENHQVKITITDNGLGIPEEIKSKIFDHLFTTKQVGKGTGLGLAIAYQIVVDTHGGALNVQSEIGQGTEFCICLPI